MRSKKISISPGTLLALVVVFVLGLASAATAGSIINGKKIKKGSVPYSALSKDAKKKLKGNVGAPGPQGAQGAGGAAAAKYWAFVTDGGPVGRGTAGVSSLYSTNGATNKQYRVSFPTDISQCSYQVSAGDTTPVGADGAAWGWIPAVTRSNIDSNTIAVTLWNSTGGGGYANQAQDSFHVAVFC